MKNITWDYIVETAPDLIKDVLEGLKDNSENPAYHPEPSTYDHIKIVTERLIKTGDMDLVMAGFFHDIGKASVSKKSDEGDWNTSPGHEGISCKLVLRYKDWIEEMGANPYVVFEIVKNHDKIKFNALNKKDKEKLERQGVYPKLSTFKDADNMNRKWDLDEQLQNVKRRELPSDLKSFVSTILGSIEKQYNNKYVTEIYDNDDEFALYIETDDKYVSIEWTGEEGFKDVIILKIERVDEVGRHLEDLYYSDVDLKNKKVKDVVKEITEIISQYLN